MSITKDGVKDKVRQFVINNFLLGTGSTKLSDDDSFLEQGIVDSTGILELVGFVEENFGIKFQDEELTPDNLDSLNKLASFVEKKAKEVAA